MITIISKNDFLIEALLQDKFLNKCGLVNIRSIEKIVQNTTLIVSEEPIDTIAPNIVLGHDITLPLYLGDLVSLIKQKIGAFVIKGVEYNFYNKLLSCGDEMVDLTEKESDLLLQLYMYAPLPVPKQDLLHKIWDYKEGVDTSTLEAHIYRLRQKFSAFGIEDCIVVENKQYSLNF